jgi:RNA polymerase sigma factor (TIGR02999 family)
MTATTIRRTPEDPSQWMQQSYADLRRIAAQQFRSERADHTWQPTELVHEVFLRLAVRGPEHYKTRAHFFGAVARSMRQALVEHARRRRTGKRGGNWIRVPMDDATTLGVDTVDVVAIHAAFEHLAAFDPKLHQIADLRVFAGLSTSEIASLLGRGRSTVRRDWSIARVWLQCDLGVPG